jgi:hypothetical protein
VDFGSGEITNLDHGLSGKIDRFYDAQMAIYKNGGLL